MKNIVICDDIMDICNQINSYIQEFCIENNKNFSVFLSNDAKTLYEIIKKEKIDLLFLDIELPDINGIEIGDYIRNKINDDDMQIVYISSIKDYSMELFKIRPNNFLIKPFTKDEIVNDIKTALKLIDKKEKMFKYNLNKKDMKQKISDIIYFESSKHKIKMVTEFETVEFYKPISEVYRELKNFGFTMCHNSFLVNIGKIIQYNKDMITMSNNTNIKISRSKRDLFMQELLHYDLD